MAAVGAVLGSKEPLLLELSVDHGLGVPWVTLVHELLYVDDKLIDISNELNSIQ